MKLTRRRMALTLSTLPLPAFAAPADAISGFFTRHEQVTGGHFGFYAHQLQSGRSLAWRADQRFVMCSTFKMSLAACVLARVDQGREHLDRFVHFGPEDLQPYAPAARQNIAKGGMSVAAMCHAAVALSDNTCANVLLSGIGGPAALTRFWRETGDPLSRLDHNEPMLNRTPSGGVDDTTTPAAMAGNVRRFLLGDLLTPLSRQMLTGWMLDCQTGLDLLRAGLPGWRVADKTGNNGNDALGDLAMASLPGSPPGQEIVICVYTRGGTTTTDSLRPVFADIGRLVARSFA
jgi:beta-lactamase class A